MTDTTSSELLESVLELTSQRDQHSLQLWLIRTLQEFITADVIELYAISANTGGLLLQLLAAVESPDQATNSNKKNRLAPTAIDDEIGRAHV